jgi:fructokinase
VTAFAPKLGGAPTNVCGAYTRLGGTSRILTQLGDDPFGHKILEELEGYGIDTSCVTLTDKANTALAFVSLEADGNRTFSFYRKPSADMLYEAEYVRSEYFEDAYALHFCSVSLGDFPMKKAHRAAIKEMRKRGGIISFDPNLRPQLWNDSIAMVNTVREFLPDADIVKVSDEEIALITCEEDIEKALPKLFVGNVKMVVYTCGKNGAHAYTRGGVSAKSEAREVKVIDTTGAGDGFIGSFLWKLQQLGITASDIENMKESELEECLAFSNEFCSRSVQKAGAIDSYPDMSDI